MRIGPYEGRRMGKGKLARRAARTLLCLVAAAALLLPAAGAWAAGAPGKMVIATRNAYVEDSVGFVEGRDADGRVMYCMDPDLHYPDRGTEVSLMGQADDVTAYLVYYGHGGQGDTGRHSHFVTQQAIWYHTDPDCDAATGKIDAGWKPRAFTEEAKAYWLEAEHNAKANSVYSGTAFFYRNGDSANQRIVGQVIKTGAIELKKSSANTKISDSSACYTLKGAEYGVYSEQACQNKVANLITDADGAARVELNAGTYWVREDKAAPGYALDTAVYKVEVAAGGTAKVNGDAGVMDVPQNDPAFMFVAKVDAETGGASPLGAGTLAGAEFTVNYYDGYFTTDTLPTTATRTWVVKTNEKGQSMLDPEYLVSGDHFYTSMDGNPTLPLGTVTIQETKAPEGYLLGKAPLSIQQITSDGTLESVRTFLEPDTENPTVTEQIKRGDLRLVKADGDSQKRLAGVAFLITSKTTGESHVAVTDANGILDTASQRGVVNANDTAWDGKKLDDSKLDAENGVYFSGSKDAEVKADDARGALPYDSYTVRELRGSANEGKKLIECEVKVTADGRTVDIGTLDDNTVTIETEAKDKATGTHRALPSSEIEVVDTVKIDGMNKGETYTLAGELVDTETGKTVLDADGNEVKAEKEFTAEGKSQKVKVSFGKVPGAAHVGKKLVVFEKLYQSGDLLATHEDASDEDQTVEVAVPEIGTEAAGEDGSKTIYTDKGTVKVIDKVSYTNLAPGTKYKLTGTLIDKATGEPLRTGEKISISTKAEDGTWKQLSGTVSAAEDGKSYTVKEKADDGTETVTTVSSAEDGSWSVKNGDAEAKTVAADSLKIEKGDLVTATAELEPEKSDGEIDMVFEFDATAMGGVDAVAFEDLSLDGTVIAKHEDAGDEKQTVYLHPGISTQAKADGKSEELKPKSDQKIIDTVHIAGVQPGRSYTLKATPMDKQGNKAIELTQTSIPGNVTADGTQTSGKVDATDADGHDKADAGSATDKAEKEDGSTAQVELPEGVSAYKVLGNGIVSFTPTATELDIEVPVTIDATNLESHDVVMFESMSRDSDGTEIAKHEDIDDKAQTVHVKGTVYTDLAQTGIIPPALALLALSCAFGAVYVFMVKTGRIDHTKMMTDQFGQKIK